MKSPRLRILVSVTGVEDVDAIYCPGEEMDAWRLCQQYLPVLLAKTDARQSDNPEAVDSGAASGNTSGNTQNPKENDECN